MWKKYVFRWNFNSRWLITFWSSRGPLHRASLVAQLVKNLPVMQETLVQFLSQKDLLEKGQATHSSFLGLPGGSASKESACNVGDLGSIPGLGRSPGEGKDYPLQYSGLENSMDCITHRVAKVRTQMTDFHWRKVELYCKEWGTLVLLASMIVGRCFLSFSLP